VQETPGRLATASVAKAMWRSTGSVSCWQRTDAVWFPKITGGASGEHLFT